MLRHVSSLIQKKIYRHFEKTDNIIFQVNIKWANSNTASILIKTNLTDIFNLRFSIQNENISQYAPKIINPKGWRYTHTISLLHVQFM